jgi:hypothetical protein
VPYASEGKGLHLPPVPEALNCRPVDGRIVAGRRMAFGIEPLENQPGSKAVPASALGVSCGIRLG